MKEFTAKFKQNRNGDFDVVDVIEANGALYKKKPNKFPLPPNNASIKAVEIHMIQLIDEETMENRTCVVNRRQYWCP
jgi:hypothetical protein